MSSRVSNMVLDVHRQNLIEAKTFDEFKAAQLLFLDYLVDGFEADRVTEQSNRAVDEAEQKAAKIRDAAVTRFMDRSGYGTASTVRMEYRSLSTMSDVPDSPSLETMTEAELLAGLEGLTGEGKPDAQ